jgi:DNA-binding response OmpR family regulator
MHVLIIEPNTLLSEAYKSALQKSGYKTTQAKGAQDAVDAADRERPDVVVMELELPGHNGIEFLHEFRSYAEWRSVPVVINTGIFSSKLAGVSKTLERDLGVSRILYKPRASLADLTRAVGECLPV